MLNKLKEINDDFERLYKQKQEYEIALRKIEGRRIDDPPSFASGVLDKYIPHRSCPNCLDDCQGWIIEGRPCNRDS